MLEGTEDEMYEDDLYAEDETLDNWQDTVWADQPEDSLTDVEADSMTLASAGFGTNEDYGFYGDDFDF